MHMFYSFTCKGWEKIYNLSTASDASNSSHFGISPCIAIRTTKGIFHLESLICQVLFENKV